MEIRLKDFDHSALLSTIIETSDVTGGGAELFLYQSGYLTIKGYINGTYLLGIPNFEVRQALNELPPDSEHHLQCHRLPGGSREDDSYGQD